MSPPRVSRTALPVITDDISLKNKCRCFSSLHACPCFTLRGTSSRQRRAPENGMSAYPHDSPPPPTHLRDYAYNLVAHSDVKIYITNESVRVGRLRNFLLFLLYPPPFPSFSLVFPLFRDENKNFRFDSRAQRTTRAPSFASERRNVNRVRELCLHTQQPRM